MDTHDTLAEHLRLFGCKYAIADGAIIQNWHKAHESLEQPDMEQLRKNAPLCSKTKETIDVFYRGEVGDPPREPLKQQVLYLCRYCSDEPIRALLRRASSPA